MPLHHIGQTEDVGRFWRRIRGQVRVAFETRDGRLVAQVEDDEPFEIEEPSPEFVASIERLGPGVHTGTLSRRSKLPWE